MSAVIPIPPFTEGLPNSLHSESHVLREALELSAPRSLRLNAAKGTFIPELPPVLWHSQGYYLNDPKQTTSGDPLWHAGAYYMQEAGSMLLQAACEQLFGPRRDLIVLDLCAAPGGKSTLLLDFLGEEGVLVSNEIIRSRVNVLKENINRWGAANCVITSIDASVMGQAEALFDFIVVDAPCSGEGMFRKDPESRKEWSKENVQLCHLRQVRILEEIWPALKPGGYLFYSTCTFNQTENEGSLLRLIEEQGALPIALTLPQDWKMHEEETAGLKVYRMMPHRGASEGFTFSVLQKPIASDFEDDNFIGKGKIIKTDAKQFKALVALGFPEDWEYYVFSNLIRGGRSRVWEIVKILQKKMSVIQAGTGIGTLGKEFIPDAELALCPEAVKNLTFPKVEVDLDTALILLEKNMPATHVDLANDRYLVSYKEVPFCFVKKTGAKWNSTWPMEWRLRNRPEADQSFLLR